MEETLSLRGIWTSFRNFWSVRTPSSSELSSMIKEEKICSLRGKIEPPTAEGIQFTLRENNWLDGLARAMQEALARLCGQSINQIKGTSFDFFPMRDANGQPLEAPYHHELKAQLEHLSFMMYDR